MNLTSTGFNPNSKNENVGSGMACGLLVAIDLPYAILVFIWNKISKKIRFRSFGEEAIKQSMYTKDKNAGFYIGFFLFVQGIAAWFNYNPFLYFLFAITFVLGIIATLKNKFR